MGCDIHFYVEIQNGLGTWQPVKGQVGTCSSCKGTGLNKDEAFCHNCKQPKAAHQKRTKKCLFDSTQYVEELPRCYDCRDGKYVRQTFYQGRNYALFGILSGVRGDSVEGWTIENRGFPEDISFEFKQWGDWGDISHSDWHSHGYYTLPELLTYDWEKAGCPDFAKTVKKMQKLDPKHPERIRAVFFYDN